MPYGKSPNKMGHSPAEMSPYKMGHSPAEMESAKQEKYNLLHDNPIAKHGSWMSKHSKSAFQMGHSPAEMGHDSPAKKHGAMKGDQSKTRLDYKNYKGTDKGYHGHSGSSHGDQSASKADYTSAAAMSPYKMGGQMVSKASLISPEWSKPPLKFEAGTPNVCGGIAFGAALDYMNTIGFEAIAAYEQSLLDYATSLLNGIDGVVIYGPSTNKTSVISFNVEGIHPYDIGTLLDKMGIAVQTGHHCAQPIMDFYNIPGTVRASFMFYNTKADVEQFVAGLKKAVLMLM